jgi:OOP family OmpA-OmpF porin
MGVLDLMARRPAIPAAMALSLAAGLSAAVAVWAVQAVEARTARAVTSQLLSSGITWARVEADGLRVVLTGTAPNEAQRLRALNLAGGVIDAGRVRDRLDVVALVAPAPPRFLVEMLRNDGEVSLIGLLPATAQGGGRDLAAEAQAAAPGASVADMLESADWPPPQGWAEAVEFGMAALALLPRAKISVAAGRVTVTAIAGSEAERRQWETDLARRIPAGVRAEIAISAPRPVLTPFTLRFVLNDGGARFDACAADTERARDRILAAGTAAGVMGKQVCPVGLGVPTPRWADAAVAAIGAVAALGRGTVTFSDADVTLTGAPDTPQAAFDRAAGELRAALPPVFSLTATPPPVERAVQEGPAEFAATLAGGKVELRGRLTDELARTAVDSFARARFGHDAVFSASRLDPDLPEGWAVRVLAGLESLAQVDRGAVTVRADTVAVSGVTGRQDARARVAQILSDRLGPGQAFTVEIAYDAALDPEAGLPEPQVCVDNLNAVLAQRKIVFDPGSAEIAPAARPTIEALAAVVRACPPLSVEIAGHTDSQGSEAGNANLSAERAAAVLAALMGHRLPLDGWLTRGYGEARPIADNATEAGREANRRIEFTLIAPPDPLPAAPLQVAAAPVDDPVNGLTRSITLSTSALGQDAAFAPTDETYPRPRRRPAAP